MIHDGTTKLLWQTFGDVLNQQKKKIETMILDVIFSILLYFTIYFMFIKND